uniref:F-box domain-containing protein n=2 Tax=Mycena chlorophos TaxID=658473 RepID=A0ABQ0M1Q4_MYCCL|nr:predicted protein [Mycena chlorophos]
MPPKLNSTTLAAVPNLPTEITIEILQILAGFPSEAPSVALTAMWIANVTRSVRLRCVVVRTQLRSFWRFVDKYPQAAEAIQNLWIATNAGAYLEARYIPRIIHACTRLESLVCQTGALLRLCEHPKSGSFRNRLGSSQWPFHFTLPDCMQTPTVRGYSKPWRAHLDALHAGAVLGSITHLHLTNYYITHLDEFPAGAFSHLTHLAVNPTRYRAGSQPPAHLDHITQLAEAVEKLKFASGRITALVVFRPDHRCPSLRELVQKARQERVLVYRITDEYYRELAFWKDRQYVDADVWTLADRQMASIHDG